jgi:hypothetical protein
MIEVTGETLKISCFPEVHVADTMIIELTESSPRDKHAAILRLDPATNVLQSPFLRDNAPSGSVSLLGR